MCKTKTDFPIDVVFLWVDGTDPNHQKKLEPYILDKEKVKDKEFRTRFDQVDEIEYAIDSVIKYATYIRNIFVITDNQVPKFLKSKKIAKKYERVTIVDHKEIFLDNLEYLPVFNSRAIETQLYKIENLSEHFIYFNDDVFLINETSVSDFFIDGKPVLRGNWFKFEEDRLIKKIKNIFIKKKNKQHTGHKISQQKGAKITGFKKYYKFNHLPFPMRKSTFRNFFELNKNVEIENIKHKFRHHNQFTPQGLMNHLEIKSGTCLLIQNDELLYFQSYLKPLFWYKLNLSFFSRRKLFMCLQSLDQCPPKKLQYFLNWFKNRFN